MGGTSPYSNPTMESPGYILAAQVAAFKGGPDGLLYALDKEGNLLFKLTLRTFTKVFKWEGFPWDSYPLSVNLDLVGGGFFDHPSGGCGHLWDASDEGFGYPGPGDNNYPNPDLCFGDCEPRDRIKDLDNYDY